MSTAGFLEERLAKASAVPAEQRSADVRAFIESCRLQAELMEELGLPEDFGRAYSSDLIACWNRWTASRALKLVRSFTLAPVGPCFVYSLPVHDFAIERLFASTSMWRTGRYPADLGRELTELLGDGADISVVAGVAAGLPGVARDRGWEEGLVKLSNHVVALMRRPGVRRRLQSQLAALPQQWVSYEELMAFFIDYGFVKAMGLVRQGGPGRTPPEVETATLHAAELLPQLAPDNPRLRYRAALIMVSCSPLPEGSRTVSVATSARASVLANLRATLDVAWQQGSDFYIALCGYQLAIDTINSMAESAAQPGLPSPSAVLGWLQQAEAAHRRCKELLPKVWTFQLDNKKAMAAPAKGALQHLQQHGDCWLPLAPAAQQELEAAVKELSAGESKTARYQQAFTCSGCGQCAQQLRLCSTCRKAQYCSVDCQKAHWREHKARCKEVQAAKAAASAGAASGSGGS